MVILAFAGAILLFVVLAALLMPWHAKRGEKSHKRRVDKDIWS